MIRTIGDAVKEAIADSGLSITDFASEIGLGRKAVYRYRSGEAVPRADTLVKIAKMSKDPAAWMASLVG